MISLPINILRNMCHLSFICCAASSSFDTISQAHSLPSTGLWIFHGSHLVFLTISQYRNLLSSDLMDEQTVVQLNLPKASRVTFNIQCFSLDAFSFNQFNILFDSSGPPKGRTLVHLRQSLSCTLNLPVIWQLHRDLSWVWSDHPVVAVS